VERRGAKRSPRASLRDSPKKCRGKRAGNRAKWGERKYVARKCHPAREYYVGRNMQSGMPNKRNRDIDVGQWDAAPKNVLFMNFVRPSAAFLPRVYLPGITLLLFRRCNFPAACQSDVSRERMLPRSRRRDTINFQSTSDVTGQAQGNEKMALPRAISRDRR